MRLLTICCLILLEFVATELAHAQTPGQIQEAQSLLVRADRDPGPVDGVWGRRTETALVDFLAERDLEFEGELTDNHLLLLRAAPEGPAFVRRDMGLRNTLPSPLRDNRDQPETEPLTVYDSWELPEWADPNPNLATLRYYFRKHLSNVRGFSHFTADAAENPRAIEFRVAPNRYLTAQMNYTALTSYLFYREGAVVHDERSPESRFGRMVTNNTGLRSNSVGKSIVSYMLGHAICEGHINGLNARLDDWPLVEDTVYQGQLIRDVADMRAGDQGVVNDRTGLTSSGRWMNTASIGSFAREELRDTAPIGQEGNRPYHYNGLATNVVMNYLIHSLEGDFEGLMDRVFRDHVGVENEVLFFRNRGYDIEDGPAWYQFYASRYDYLRIALTMLEDWESESCIGQYLRDIEARSQPKNNRDRYRYISVNSTHRYAGQFHAGYAGMEDRNVLGMDGYGGQIILIDFDNARIVVVNSVHLDYDYQQIVHLAIQNGRLP